VQSLSSDHPFALSGYQCIYCNGPAEQMLMLNFRADDDDEKPSLMVAYTVCNICRVVAWEDSKPMRVLHDCSKPD